MFVLHSYAWAVLLCVVTMLCWGSWANTQKLARAGWRFELFYWDYTLGVVLLSVGAALTLGSLGAEGRRFLEDLAQADSSNLLSAFVGGVIFNAANILLVAAIDIAGMAVAFPVGIGLALVLGVVVNYLGNPVGNAVLLFAGVGLVALAILLDAIAYRKLPGQSGRVGTKGLGLSVACGILMGLFYRFVAASMSTCRRTTGAMRICTRTGPAPLPTRTSTGFQRIPAATTVTSRPSWERSTGWRERSRSSP